MTKQTDITPRTTTYYSAQPVCTALWTTADWDKTAAQQTEPLTIEALGKVWRATHRGEDGQIYYTAD